MAINDFLEKFVPALWMLRASGMEPKHMFKHFEVPPPVRGQRILANWLRQLHEQNRAHVPAPDSIALALIGALHANNLFRHVVGEEFVTVDRKTYVEDIVQHIWVGIAPRP